MVQGTLGFPIVTPDSASQSAGMGHFAFLCPPYVSHIRTFEALGEELVRRGHRATFLLNAGAGKLVRSELVAVEEAPLRPGDPSAEKVLKNARHPGGLWGTFRTIKDSAAMTDQLCACGADIIPRIGADMIVGDQLEPATGLLAAHLRLPQVNLACALPINTAPGVPLPFLDWSFDATPAGIRKAQGGERIAHLLMRSHYRVISTWADRFRIGPRRTLIDCLSLQGQVAQVTRGFDFPRPLPIPFEAVGPMRNPDSTELEAPIPFNPDGRRPLVFATMGTLQGGRLRVFRALARACKNVGAELVVAHGGLLDRRRAESIGADHVFDFVPQRAVLARAALCVSHAGLNTVLDCLASAVPMIVRPIAFDQKGTTSRILSCGVGERMVPLWNARALAAQIDRVLTDQNYRKSIEPLSAEIRNAGGTARAADIVEAVYGESLGPKSKRRASIL
jgi:zeaxanthin glucosyltransferase